VLLLAGLATHSLAAEGNKSVERVQATAKVLDEIESEYRKTSWVRLTALRSAFDG